MTVTVVQLRADSDLCWSFENKEPHFYVEDGSYKRQVKVDPFPCYAHDIALVGREAERVAAAFPLPQPVYIYALDRESESRTNGWTIIGVDYDASHKEGELRPWAATITLSGKRIPIHPAMTRYLVSHEYGHVVAEHVRRRSGEGEREHGKMYREYAEMRGFKSPNFYGGTTWHASTCELFANDFRILVAQSELEFWPHPGFPRPEELPQVVEFWRKEVEAVKVCESPSEVNQ